MIGCLEWRISNSWERIIDGWKMKIYCNKVSYSIGYIELSNYFIKGTNSIEHHIKLKKNNIIEKCQCCKQGNKS